MGYSQYPIFCTIPPINVSTYNDTIKGKQLHREDCKDMTNYYALTITNIINNHIISINKQYHFFAPLLHKTIIAF